MEESSSDQEDDDEEHEADSDSDRLATWEPEGNLEGARDAIDAYNRGRRG